MDVSLEAGTRPKRVSSGIVSILVLVDVSLEGHPHERAGLRIGFQSLFSWMFRSKPNRSRIRIRS